MELAILNAMSQTVKPGTHEVFRMATEPEKE